MSVDSVASGGHAANKQHVLGAALEPHIGSLRNEHGSYPQLYKMQRDEETWNLITARPWPLIDILIGKKLFEFRTAAIGCDKKKLAFCF